MASVHMLIGIGEGLISALVYVAIQRTRPELIPENNLPAQPRQRGELVAFGLLAALGVAVFIAPFACSWPDGLDSVAKKFGFDHKLAAPMLYAPAPDYHVPGIHWAIGATALAGVLGSLIVCAFAWLLGRFLVTEQKSKSPPA